MNIKNLLITSFVVLAITNWGSLHAVNVVYGVDAEQILDSDSPSLTALIDNPVALTGSSGTVGDTLTVLLSGGSTTGVTYSTSSANCSVTSLGAVTATSAGTCSVSVSIPADSIYSAFSGSADYVFTAALINNPVVLSGLSGTLPSTLTVSLVGGSTTGVTYSTSSANCSVSDAGVVTATSAGTCSVSVSIPADSTYLAFSGSADYVFALATQSALSLNSITWAGDGTATLATSGGSGSGAVTYSATGICSVTGSSITASGTGSCDITATKAAQGIYASAVITETVTISAVDQASVSFDLSSTSFSDTTATLPAATGGSGTGTVSYTVASGPCTVSGSTLTATGIGTCSVTATKAGSGLYSDESASDTIAFSGQSQSSLTASISGSTVSTSGGSGSGAVTFAASPSTVCTISGSTITGVASGTCTVTATKASSGVYLSASATATTTFSLPITTTSLNSNWKKITYSTSGGTSITARRNSATSACSSLGDGWALANRSQINGKASGSSQHFFSLPARKTFIASDCTMKTQNAGIPTNACYSSGGNASKPWIDVALCRKP